MCSLRLQRTVDGLEERLRALNTAIKLYSFAGGVNSILELTKPKLQGTTNQ